MKKKVTVNLRQEKVNTHLKTNLLNKKKKEEHQQPQNKRKNKIFDYLNKEANGNK